MKIFRPAYLSVAEMDPFLVKLMEATEGELVIYPTGAIIIPERNEKEEEVYPVNSKEEACATVEYLFEEGIIAEDEGEFLLEQIESSPLADDAGDYHFLILPNRESEHDSTQVRPYPNQEGQSYCNNN